MIRAIFEVAAPKPSVQVTELGAETRYRYAESQTEWVSLGAPVEYVEANAEVRFRNLVGDLRYINLQAANVYADPTPPDRWVNDFQLLADQLDIVFVKVLSDAATALDVIATKNLGKRNADTFGVSDSSSLGFGKGESDSSFATDGQPTIGFGKNSSDIQTTADVSRYDFSSSKEDYFSAIDAYASHLHKPADDSASLSDAQYISFGSVYSDNVSNNDDQSISLEKALADIVTTDDIFSAEDELQQAIGKTLSDDFSVTDESSIVVDFNREFDETLYIIDESDISFLKGNSDSADTSDSGLLFMTDYADITYFAEDYVGVSRTF